MQWWRWCLYVEGARGSLRGPLKGKPTLLRRDPAIGEEAPFAAERGGVRLGLRVTTRADRNALGGVIRDADGRPVLQVRLVAPPVEGAANRALIEFLAGSLGLRKADISIRSGATARLKVLHLAGDSAAITARLTEWIGTGHAALRPP
jgi:uncharacterized protein